MERAKLVVDIKFVGVDNWNRPVFKATNSKEYYGSVTSLFNYDSPQEEIVAYFQARRHELEYFGTSFDCEPNGGLSSNIELNIVD